MKKIFALISAVALVMLTAVGKDFLIHLSSGEDVRYSTEDIQEIRFDATSVDAELPEDPYPSATDFSRKVMLMDHTGTGCQHCPLMTMALRQLEADQEYSEKYTLAVLHSYPNDPMGTNLVCEISDAYHSELQGFPYTTIDLKRDGVGISNSNYLQTADRLRTLIDNEFTDVTPSGVASVAKLTDRTIDLTLAVKAGETGDYRVGAILLENGIEAYQTNSWTAVTGDEDFNTHNNVVRTIVGRDGDNGFSGITLGNVEKGETSYTTQTITLADGWKAENCRLLIYVSEKIGNKYICVNSAYAPIDGSTTYAYDSTAPATDSYVTLSKTLVEATAAAGSYTVPITLKNGADISKVKVTTTADWISNVTLTASEISFDVTENSSDSSRKGRISISYDDARPIDISIQQHAVSDDQKDLFSFETTVISPYSVNVSITPNGFTGNYLFFVVQASGLDRYIDAGNLDGWMEGDLTWLEEQAESTGRTLSEFLQVYKQAYSMNGAPVSITYTDLSADTDYYVYCYGMDLDGKVTTDFYKHRFSTSVVNLVDLTFTASVTDITTTTANIQITPSNNTDSYFWTYVSDMDWAQYDLNFIMDNMIQNIMTEVSYGSDINSIIHKGPSSEKATDLWKGTTYHLVGWGMDEKGSATTAPVEIGTFSTESLDIKNNCTFTVDFPTVKDNDIQVHVTPTDNSIRYYVAFVAESKCTGYNNEQMAQRLINMEQKRFDQSYYGADSTWDNVEWMLSGEQTKWGRQDLYWTFSPSTTYNVYIFGVDSNGERNTHVYYTQKTTLSAGESDMTIDITLNEDQSDWQYGSFTFKPSRDDEYYIPLLVETEELKYVTNSDGTLNASMISAEIDEYYDHSANYYTTKGESTQKFRWNSDSDYTMLVCGWSGGNTTPFFRYDCHTPKIGFGEGKGDVSCTWELFDGTALSEIDYNRWKDYLGYVVIRLQFDPNEYADYYCGGVWMPESNYSDIGGVDYLLTLIQNPDVSIVNRRSAMYRTLVYGTTYSLSYVAKDSEGRYGPWHYVEFTPTAGENITEAYDFWTTPSSAPEYIYAVSKDGKVSCIGKPSFSNGKAVKSERKVSSTATKSVLNSQNSSDSLGRNK